MQEPAKRKRGREREKGCKRSFKAGAKTCSKARDRERVFEKLKKVNWMMVEVAELTGSLFFIFPSGNDSHVSCKSRYVVTSAEDNWELIEGF